MLLSKLFWKIDQSEGIIKADTDILSQAKLSNEIKWRLIQNLPENLANIGQLK